MTSPPPTPPPCSAHNSERRFKNITLPCEWIEDYRPGGYHPVTLGDLFHQGRYRILRKLGEGSFSTAWLARDVSKNQNVALKIRVANDAEHAAEERMLKHITDAAPDDAWRYIVQPLDEFTHHGPNGTHKCLVFEPMGPSVNVMVEELPQFKPRMWGMKVRYPPQMAKSILKQSLQALGFLHSRGITHGDFQPGNMLFSLDNISSLSEDALRQKEDVGAKMISPPVERLDGKKDLWSPPYLCVAQPLALFTPYENGFKIKLSDMAYFSSDKPPKPVTSRGLRGPEYVFAGEMGPSLDIWSFGCLVFEIITGRPLFCVLGSKYQDDDHIMRLIARLGPPPDKYYEVWKTSSCYFTPDGVLYNCLLGGVPEGREPLMLPQTTIEEAFDAAEPDIDEHERQEVKKLLRWILQYDFAKRPTATEILQHPWFQKIGTD